MIVATGVLILIVAWLISRFVTRLVLGPVDEAASLSKPKSTSSGTKTRGIDASSDMLILYGTFLSITVDTRH